MATEPAEVQLARTLPVLRRLNGTTNSSLHEDRLSHTFMFPWTGFENRVVSTIEGLDLSAHISLTESSDGERYIIGNELGLTGKVVQNLCEPVNKALEIIGSDVVFGDAHVALMSEAIFPDTIVLRHDGSAALGVGEVKTWWTIRVEMMSVRGEKEVRRLLERPIGQVVSYMRQCGLRYGFLTTYNATIFVRRADNFRFELSEPILSTSQGPSVRECLLAFILMMAEDGHFEEDPDLNFRLLTGAGIQAPTRGSFFGNISTPPGSGSSSASSPYSSSTSSNIHTRHKSEPKVQMLGQDGGTPSKTSMRRRPGSHKNVTNTVVPPVEVASRITKSTLFFGDEGLARSRAEVGDWISGNPASKAVFAGTWGDENIVIKFYSPAFVQCFETESEFYKTIAAFDMPEVKHFPGLMAYGNVILSNRMSEGYVLLLSCVAGVQLHRIWDSLDEGEKDEVKIQVRDAIRVLRVLDVWQSDAGLGNMIWDGEKRHLTLVDFEDLDPAVGEGSEMLKVFGHK